MIYGEKFLNEVISPIDDKKREFLDYYYNRIKDYRSQESFGRSGITHKDYDYAEDCFDRALSIAEEIEKKHNHYVTLGMDSYGMSFNIQSNIRYCKNMLNKINKLRGNN